MLKTKSVAVLVLALILSVQMSFGWVHAFSGDQLTDPLSTKPVTIDGKWTSSDEWSDAAEVALSGTCSGCAGQGFLYMKHDASNFYFLEDFVTATSIVSLQNDGASVTFDSAHAGGNILTADDVRFDSMFPTGGSMAVGTGGSQYSWNQPLPAGVQIAMSVSSSPNSAVHHEITEFSVPFSTFPNLPSIIGFAAAAFQDNSKLVIWPPNYLLDSPSTWGELTISPTPVPEFSFMLLLMTLTLFSALVLVRKRTINLRARV